MANLPQVIEVPCYGLSGADATTVIYNMAARFRRPVPQPFNVQNVDPLAGQVVGQVYPKHGAY